MSDVTPASVSPLIEDEQSDESYFEEVQQENEENFVDIEEGLPIEEFDYGAAAEDAGAPAPD